MINAEFIQFVSLLDKKIKNFGKESNRKIPCTWYLERSLLLVLQVKPP